MRTLTMALWSVVLVSAAAAQAPVGGEAAPGIAVTKTDWVYASTDSRQEAEAARLRGERVETGGGIAPVSVRTFPAQWEASVELKNGGPRSIKSISLELVFDDAVTKDELLRYRLSSDTEFGPGETVTLRKRVNDTRKGYFRVTEGNKKRLIPRQSAATRRVEIKQIEYADGTTWRP